MGMQVKRRSLVLTDLYVCHYFSIFYVFSLCETNCAGFSCCRPISDVSSDLTIEVGSSSFALHKVSSIQVCLRMLLFSGFCLVTVLLLVRNFAQL